jgi:hypothetical protein
MARATFRVNADSWTHLQQILVGTPDDFNPDSASLRGRKIEKCIPSMYLPNGTGRMPDPDAHVMRDSVVTYVIYSYETPVAYRRVRDWNGNGTANYEWIVPDARYSVTTSKHQGRVRTALSQISGGI